MKLETVDGVYKLLRFSKMSVKKIMAQALIKSEDVIL